MSTSIHIKIPTITGQSEITGHEAQLEVLSFSHGASIPAMGHVSNKDRTAGHANFQDLAITRYSDSATPQLMQALSGGTVLHGDTVLTIARSDKDTSLPLFVITLTDVIVSSLSYGGSGGGDVPVETITLNYTKIKMEYSVQKSEGGKEGVTPFQFNLATNSAH